MVVNVDKNMSEKIHIMKTSWYMEIMLVIPIYAMNPYVLPFTAAFIALLFSNTEREIMNIEDIAELEPER